MARHLHTALVLGTATTLLLILPISLPGGFFSIPKLALTGLWVTILSLICFLNRAQLHVSAPRPLLYLLGASTVWIILSNLLLSPYREFTLVGWPNWYSGLFQSLLILAVFTLALVQHRAPSQTEEGKPAVFLSVFFWLSVIVVTVSVLERLGYNPIIGSPWFVIPDLPEGFNTSYPIVTVGNPGWLAGFWLLMLPLPLLLLNTSRLFLPWTLICALGVASTSNKTSMYLALALYVFLLVGMHLKSRNSFSKITVVAALAILLLSSPSLSKLNVFLYDIGLAPRVSTVAETDVSAGGTSLQGRFILWKGTSRLVSERPWTGWGLDTLQMNFFRSLTPSEYRELMTPVLNLKKNETARSEGFLHLVFGSDKEVKRMHFFIMVKPHNAFLEELYSHGISGLIILVVTLIYCFNIIIRWGGSTERILLLACALYGIYLLVWFMTIAVTPIAAALLGFAVATSNKNRLRLRI